MSKGKATNKAKLIALLVLIAIITGIITYNGVHLAKQVIYPKKYSELIETTADDFGIEKNLLYALVRTESGFDADAVSEADAKGLTQITPDTFTWLCTKTGEEHADTDLFKPEVSVYYGAYFLNLLINEFGDTKTALAAYHAGRGKVNEWLQNSEYSSDGKTLDKIPYSDTSAYVDKVMKTADKYSEIYDM